jgi:misacylated tRNA(Ala) deacylase
LTEPLFRDDPYLTACEARVVAVHGDAVELDRTVFYPMAGGQPGDTGRIGAFRVLDTRKGDSPESILHVMEPGFDLPVDSFVRISIDRDRRYRHMRSDTIETRVNELVKAALETKAHWISDAELDSRPDLVKTMSVAPPRGEGRVRLLDIPGVDLQACGGTHVRNTAEIGTLAVTRIRSEGKRNKRVTLVLA